MKVIEFDTEEKCIAGLQLIVWILADSLESAGYIVEIINGQPWVTPKNGFGVDQPQYKYQIIWDTPHFSTVGTWYFGAPSQTVIDEIEPELGIENTDYRITERDYDFVGPFVEGSFNGRFNEHFNTGVMEQ